MAHNVFIFVPAFGQTITATTFLCTHALIQTFISKSIGCGVSTLSFPDIAELRAMAVSIWYDTMPNNSHLLFIDADMGFTPEVVMDMLLLDEPLVGSLYAQRKQPLSFAGSGTGEPQTARRGNFMLVEGVGMGCTLIRRDCITRMLEKFPQCIDTRLALHPAGETMRQAGCHRMLRLFEKLDLPERGIVSEDLSFCIRARQVGIITWACIGHKFAHVGPYDFGEKSFMAHVDAINAKTAADEVAAAAAKAAQPPAPPAPMIWLPTPAAALVPASPVPEPVLAESAVDLAALAPNGPANGPLEQSQHPQ